MKASNYKPHEIDRFKQIGKDQEFDELYGGAVIKITASDMEHLRGGGALHTEDGEYYTVVVMGDEP